MTFFESVYKAVYCSGLTVEIRHSEREEIDFYPILQIVGSGVRVIIRIAHDWEVGKAKLPTICIEGRKEDDWGKIFFTAKYNGTSKPETVINDVNYEDYFNYLLSCMKGVWK